MSKYFTCIKCGASPLNFSGLCLKCKKAQINKIRNESNLVCWKCKYAKVYNSTEYMEVSILLCKNIESDHYNHFISIVHHMCDKGKI